MKNKKKITIFATLAVVAVVLITAGITYAIFTYSAVGETLSTIRVGSITFHYKEENGKGRGISITDAAPVTSNDTAKSSNNYFDFKITSTTTDKVRIPYTVTAKVSDDTDISMGNIVDMYLTEVTDKGEVTESESPTPPFANTYPKFNDLTSYKSDDREKVILNSTVPENYNGTYERNYRLRMWIDQRANMSGTVETKYYCGETDVTTNVTANSNYKCAGDINPSVKHESGSPYNNKTFSITVNVYSKGEKVNEYFNSLEVDGYTPTPVTGQAYDREVTIPFPSGSPELSYDIDTLDGEDDISVNVTRMNSDFTSEYSYNNTSNTSNDKVKRIANFNNYLSIYSIDGDFGNIYLKVDVVNNDTNQILSTVKLKVHINRPNAGFDSFDINSNYSTDVTGELYDKEFDIEYDNYSNYINFYVDSETEYYDYETKEMNSTFTEVINDYGNDSQPLISGFGTKYFQTTIYATNTENYGEVLYTSRYKVHINKPEVEITDLNMEYNNATDVTGELYDKEIVINYDGNFSYPSISFSVDTEFNNYNYETVEMDSTFTQVLSNCGDSSSFSVDNDIIGSTKYFKTTVYATNDENNGEVLCSLKYKVTVAYPHLSFSNIKIDNHSLTPVSNQNYDYEITMPANLVNEEFTLSFDVNGLNGNNFSLDYIVYEMTDNTFTTEDDYYYLYDYDDYGKDEVSMHNEVTHTGYYKLVVAFTSDNSIVLGEAKIKINFVDMATAPWYE